MSKFEDEVLKLLGEMNQHQIATNKRLDNIEKGLEEVRETARITRDYTVSLREDVNTITEKIDVYEKEVEGVGKEQEYQLSKWVEHDRRINKLERKMMS